MRALLAVMLAVLALPCAAGELQPFGRGSWTTLRQNHAGKPVVVHLWGLTCGPCLAELPEWGKLARERKDAGIVMIAADPYPVTQAALAATLERNGLSGVESWIFDGFSERLRFEIDPRWQGELPRTLLIGADASVKVMPGVADLSEVRAWLDAQRPPG